MYLAIVKIDIIMEYKSANLRFSRKAIFSGA